MGVLRRKRMYEQQRDQLAGKLLTWNKPTSPSTP